MVARADSGRPLERHVFHHVRQPGRADLVVGGTHIDDGREAEHGGLVPLDDDEAQAVREREFLYLPLKGFEAGAKAGSRAGCGRGWDRLRPRLRPTAGTGLPPVS